MKYTLLFALTILLTISTNAYLIGKHEARAEYGEAYKLVMDYGDFVTQLELASIKSKETF